VTDATEQDATPVQLLAENSDRAMLLILRWLGTWVDLIVLVVLSFGPPVLAVMILGRDAAADWTRDIGAIAILGFLLIPLLYFIVLEALWGVSLGKLVTGLRVVDKSGRPPGAVKAIVRTLLRLLEVNPLLLGGIPAGIAVLATKRKQRLGDMAAGTYVLSRRKIREALKERMDQVFS
jgi:uncharacterized RDD family membrane protein YckC